MRPLTTAFFEGHLVAINAAFGVVYSDEATWYRSLGERDSSRSTNKKITRVYMYGYCLYQSIDQPGKVVNPCPARGQNNKENIFSLSQFAPLKIGLTRQVRPSRPAPACWFFTLGLNLIG